MSNDSNDWYESGPIRDMKIRNNTFYIKDIGRTSWEYAPAIYIHPVTKGGQFPDASNPIHKNISIEGNTFYMDEDTVVKAESVENLTFKNNKVFRMNPDVKIDIALENKQIETGQTIQLKTDVQGNTNDKRVDNVFEFTKSKDITIENNVYDDGLKLYAVAEDDATADNITIKGDDIKVIRDKNQAPAAPARNIYYASSNPDIVSVDKNGQIAGQKAGTATIFAYYR
ncbi:MAG: Ig-like domain-containing protein [Coprococcus sp.]